MSRKVARPVFCLALLLFSTHIATATDFKREVIYQIITDRFVDGDPSNNDPAQSAGMFDPTRTNWRAYWGGDFEGIRQKLSYLAGMGVTAIWISPPADNLNAVIRTSSGRATSSFYGYQARDFKRIEEHFGDSSNSWAAFDNLVAAAHELGIKVVVDFAPNHSSAVEAGEDGALYDDGEFIGKYSQDASGYFHHFGFISNAYRPFEAQYYSLYGLADINQENPRMDAYLKASAHLYQQHGADGFRIDGLKHVSWGWFYSLANSIYSRGDSFIFGEWYLENTPEPLYWEYAFANSVYSPGGEFPFPQEYRGAVNDTLYTDAFKLSNGSGASLIDFPLNEAIRNVFGKTDADFSEIDSVISLEAKDILDDGALVTFIDSHDKVRFLSTYDSRERLNLALSLLLTARGIPCIYYGTEQYLHNDTRGGGDPYNRQMMDNFSTTTAAYTLINKLSALRRSNPAIPYGTMESRRVEPDVYIYERKFFNHVVLVAINKSASASRIIEGLHTSLPPGSYTEHLEGQFGGSRISVATDAAGANKVASFSLPAHAVSVWSYVEQSVAPQVGSVWPRRGQPGMKVRISGNNFGQARGSVTFGAAAAEVVSWGETEITFIVPATASGQQRVFVTAATGQASNQTEFDALTASLVPVVFNVRDTSSSPPPGSIFVSGNVSEMGNWEATWQEAIGPLLSPNGKDWTICASLPAGKTIQFRLFRLTKGGLVRWAGGEARSYTVPESGVGRVDVEWVD